MLERFLTKIAPTVDGCWLWTAAKCNGYGYFKADRWMRAHRWAYQHFKGPIPHGLTLDHLCRQPACVNPDHLEAVPIGVNVSRGTGLTVVNANKTHCSQGHPFDLINTIWYDSGTKRRCRECRKRWYQPKGASG